MLAHKASVSTILSVALFVALSVPHLRAVEAAGLIGAVAVARTSPTGA